MANGKNRLYLQKDGMVQTNMWSKNDIPQKYPNPTFLFAMYEPKVDMLKSFAGQNYDEQEVEQVSKIIEKAQNSQTCIKFLVHYDKFCDKFKVMVDTTIEKSLADSIREVLSEPTIHISGTLSLNKYLRFQFKYPEWETYELHIPDITFTEQTIKILDVSPEMEKFCLQEDHADAFTIVKVEYSVTLEWIDNTQGPVIKFNVMEKLWNDKTLSDCSIIASNDAEIKCHQNILAVHSQVLETMLSNGFEETHTKRIPMKDTSEAAVHALLAFLYQWDTKPAEQSDSIALELLQLAHKYNIESLEKTMLHIFSTKPDEWFTINIAFELYFFVLNVDKFAPLQEKMLGILKRNPGKLRESEEFKHLLDKHPSEAAELAFKLLQVN